MDREMNMIAVPFEFKSKQYCSLVRVKSRQGHTEFHVTIMNGDLERNFYGNHIYRYSDGVLEAHNRADDPQLSELQARIAWAIMDYLGHNTPEDVTGVK